MLSGLSSSTSQLRHSCHHHFYLYRYLYLKLLHTYSSSHHLHFFKEFRSLIYLYLQVTTVTLLNFWLLCSLILSFTFLYFPLGLFKKSAFLCAHFLTDAFLFFSIKFTFPLLLCFLLVCFVL
jgi:hypothetical protein